MKAIFLDRDGIINEAIVKDGKPFAPLKATECQIIKGVPERLKQLHRAGFQLFVVTNQPDISRGKAKASEIDQIHEKIHKVIPEITEFKTCPHQDSDGCLCRKPLPGMLIKVAAAYHVDLSQSYMVGDRWRDIEAGRAAGCKTLFVDYKYNEDLKSKPDFTFQSSVEALDFILLKA